MLNWIKKKRNHKTKLTKDNLVYAFVDNYDNMYYSFPKGVEMPILRLAKMQEFLMWLQKGVSKDEYIKAIEYAEKALENGLKDTKGVAKIGFILHELKDRCNMVLHDELFFNIIAIQVVRWDEDVSKFNNKTHMEKVEAIKELSNDDGFFLSIQELLMALNYRNITKEAFQKLIQQSQALREATERMMK